jgi:SAM-dependent methyltransferase
MPQNPLFTKKQYFRKLINTFFPRWLYALSPWRNSETRHWGEQTAGDIHGYDKYTAFHNRIPILISELDHRISKEDRILDLGCNCGYYLSEIRKNGYKNLTGIDISGEAIRYGKTEFGFCDDELKIGSFEEVLPQLHQQKKSYVLTYSMGATLELVHPSFDVIKAICDVTEKYVILIISEWGHRYPRFWEYEFNRQGFLLIRSVRPFDGSEMTDDPGSINSLLIFRRVEKR